jgi:hypothetical protein
VAVLPYGLDYDERSVRRYLAKHLHPILLGVDKTMLLLRVNEVAPLHFIPLLADGAGHSFFDTALRGPAFLIGRQAKVAIGYENHRLHIKITGYRTGMSQYGLTGRGTLRFMSHKAAAECRQRLFDFAHRRHRK